MTEHDDEPQHRAFHQPDPDDIHVRDIEPDDGTFVVRMPIVSTGEVRNEGDDPLTREEIDGMARQIEERPVSVFLDHGGNMDVAGSRYSAVGKVGEWENPEVATRDHEDTHVVEADARLMDPETLPAATGAVREALAALKSQVERDMALSSSIGWRDDESFPGGVDLMEASIVGIPADPRTTSQDAIVELARAARDNRDADPEQLVADFRAVVMGPDTEHDRHLSAQQAEIAETLLNAYRNEQGNGSVENFEGWLWNVAYHQFDENEFHAAQTALREFYRATTPLEEPVDEQFAPFLDDKQSGESGDENQNMTDEPDAGDDPGDDRDGSGDMDAAEYRESMLEMQRQQTETLSTLAEAIRDGDDEGTEEPEEEQALEIDGEEYTADDVRDLREQLEDAEPEPPDDERESDEDSDEDEDRKADPYDKYDLKKVH